MAIRVKLIFLRLQKFIYLTMERKGAISLGLEVIVLIIIALALLIIIIYLINTGLLANILHLKQITNQTNTNITLP